MLSQKNHLSAFKLFSLSASGFTLIELMTAMAVMAVTIMVSLGFIFSVRNKAVLRNDLDNAAAALDYARQQSIISYQGHAYSTTLNPDGVITIDPDGTKRKLSKTTRFLELTDPITISFAKLTGAANPSAQFTLTRGDLQGTITVESSGHITTSEITRSP